MCLFTLSCVDWTLFVVVLGIICSIGAGVIGLFVLWKMGNKS